MPKKSSVIVVKRYDNIIFGRKPELIDNFIDQSLLYSSKIVDDSSYTPNSNYIRAQLASGSAFSKGVYDFNDGFDNGFTPSMRSLTNDIAEMDQAAQAVVAEAKAKADKQSKAEQAKAESERNEKILNNLASLSDDGSASPGSSSDS